MGINLKQKEIENERHEVKFLFNLSLADILRLTMFGVLVAILNEVLRLPMHLPGHTSLWWMGVLVLGKGLIPKRGGGIIMGIVSGVLAVFFGLGSEGIFVFFTYFAPGLMLDILGPIFRNRWDSPFVAVVCSIFASLSKLAANMIIGILLDMPMVFLTLGLGYSAVTHTLFGGLGGFLAVILIRRLKPRLANWD